VAGVQPELRYDAAQPHLGFIHKVDRTDGSEFFFLRNRTREERTAAVTLVAGGRTPVLLDLWTGRMMRLSGEIASAQTTGLAMTNDAETAAGGIRLALRFAPYESKLIWLADGAVAQEFPLAPEPVMGADLEPVVAVEGFSFAADQRLLNGASKRIEIKLPGLKDWRQLPELAALGDPGEYTATFTLAAPDPERRYFLQLDRVCDRADIVLNGQALDPLLVPPWRCEITGLLVAGENTLKITVTPTVRNRLVGYANARNRDYQQYKGQPLMPAGLIGAVTVCATRQMGAG
jgi:hypothetical protein